MNKILIGLLILSMVIVAGCASQSEPMPEIIEEDNAMVVEDAPVDEMVVEEEAIMEEGDVKVFVVKGDNFNFYLDGVVAPDIVVQEGDKVRIEFESIGGFHDWVVDEFDAATEKVGEGGTTSVEFIASEKGTFEYYCSVGSHRANGMVGNLIVE